jgi:hypothetical protein
MNRRHSLLAYVFPEPDSPLITIAWEVLVVKSSFIIVAVIEYICGFN